MFRSSSPQSPESSLRLPAQKRINAPNSDRLTTITEGGDTSPPPIPRRSSRRNSATNSLLNSQRNSRRWSRGTQDTHKSAPPPPYEWVPEPIEARNDSPAVVDERLEKLRRGESTQDNRRRGGWTRLAVVIGVALLVIIALAVGLGVGLTRKKHHKSQGETSGPSPGNGPPQKFPLGEYSLITALKGVETTCTSNPATWRCYPYVPYSPDGSTNSSSLASFNWIISNTSSTYATNTSGSTPDEGVPANLTVSTQNDPFGITFNKQPLTYVSTTLNASSTRYTFTFTMPKMVIPSPAVTADNSAAECFFNQSIFTGNLYLSAPHNFPSGALSNSSISGGYEQWPYAVDITQTAIGGANVPNCYETVDGHVGARITDGLIAEAASAQCLCDYRNY